jgi:AcrR family transcriptional regulator
MSRTANPERPQELRDAIIRYLLRHGLSDLSLRPLAKAVGSSPRVLLYYFGSKEKMVMEIVKAIRQQQLAAFGEIDEPTFAESCLIVWKRMTARDSEPLFRLYFEIYGIALRHPKRYRSFLRDTVEDWLSLIADPLCGEGHELGESRAFASIVLAGLRGFMLDYCTTHDRRRLDRAVGLWLSSLDPLLPALRRSRQS